MKDEVRENSNAILAIYQDDGMKMMYGYIDCTSNDYGMHKLSMNDSDILEKWMKLHEGVFTKKERDRLFIAPIPFRDTKSRMRFLAETRDIYMIDCMYGISDLCVTGYESTVYDKTITEWYRMYQNVVLASQVLPCILYEDEKMTKVMRDMTDVADQMYEMVTSKERFASFLSTTHVKATLVRHPMSVFREYAEERDWTEMFRYQLFKD